MSHFLPAQIILSLATHVVRNFNNVQYAPKKKLLPILWSNKKKSTVAKNSLSNQIPNTFLALEFTFDHEFVLINSQTTYICGQNTELVKLLNLISNVNKLEERTFHKVFDLTVIDFSL